MWHSVFPVVLLVGVGLAEGRAPCSKVCVVDDCLGILKAPAVKTLASSFCSSFNQPTVTKTVVATKTASDFATQTLEASTETDTATVTKTTTVVDLVTSNAPVPTVTITSTSSSYEYIQTIAPGEALKRRHDLHGFPGLELFEESRISSACSCIVGVPSSTSTVFDTVSTTTATVFHTETVSASNVVLSVTQTSVLTSIVDVTVAGPATNTATATVIDVEPITTSSVCSACVSQAGTTRSILRIEGETETIYEGCIYSGPCTVTTPSGGTHSCDSTNNGANPTPADTPTCDLMTASQTCGFGFDGTFDSAFDDYFITSIGDSTETSTQFWGLLLNYQFTPVGGCQQAVAAGDEVLWAFDAFNKAYFLKATVSATETTLGTPVTVTVTDGSSGTPISGAQIGNVVTDANGNAELLFTKRGAFSLKASRSDSIRSNAVIVIVN